MEGSAVRAWLQRVQAAGAEGTAREPVLGCPGLCVAEGLAAQERPANVRPQRWPATGRGGSEQWHYMLCLLLLDRSPLTRLEGRG